MTDNLKFIDLFCGIGGFRLALESLNNNCVFSSDIDNEAKKIYLRNFNENPEGDISKIPNATIPKHDVICAGFPCQPFSISGKQKGFKDIRGTLFYEIVRIAEYHQPKYLFLENVGNFLGHNNGETLKTVVKNLDKINYYTYYSVMNASDYGIPQSRKRIYFIAVRKDLIKNHYAFPKPTYKQCSLNDILLDDEMTSHLVINRKDIQIKKNKDENYLFKINLLKPNRIGTVNKGGQGERIYSVDGHAITLSAYGGGVGAKTGLYLVNEKIRKLHPIECKRLMTFPEDYSIHENDNQAYKQFGNSVVVEIIKIIFEKLLKDFEWQKKNKMQKLEMKLKDYSLIH